MSVEVTVEKFNHDKFWPVKYFVRVTHNDSDYSEFRYFWTRWGAKKCAASVKYPLGKEISK